MSALSFEEANAVYDVLVAHAGEEEREYSRAEFVHHQTTGFCPEFWFMGALGFGGKFRRGYDRWYVDAYAEDMTPERHKLVAVTNAALADVRARFQAQVTA